MASNIQFTKETAASVPVADAGTKSRLFVDSADGRLKIKDDLGNSVGVGEFSAFPGATVSTPVVAGQTLVANEVLPVGAIVGAVNFDLPALAGVLEGSDLFAVVDLNGLATTHAITITPDGAETINGVNAPINLLEDYGIRGLIKTSSTNWTIIYGDASEALAHTTTHISGGADEIDGDQLDIDWNPSNYSPTTSPAEADSVDHLTAHLAGIDASLGSVTRFDGTVQTTDATVTTIATVTTVTNEAVWIEANIIGRDGTANEAASYKIYGLFDNAAGTVTQTGSTAVLASLEDDATWDAVFTISGTDVLLQVQGDATNTVEWRVTGSYDSHG